MSFTSKLRKGGLVAVATGVAFGLVLPTAAHADPGTSPRTYQAAGSDTLDPWLNGVTNGYNGYSSFQSNLGSWDAFGSPDPIKPKSTGQSLGRPHGSGDGVAALSASRNPNNDVFTQTVNGVATPYDLKNGVATGVDGTNDSTREIDLARASSRPSSSNIRVATDSDAFLTYVPVARDAVSVAFQSHGSTVNVPDLDQGALAFIYNAASTGTYIKTVAGVNIYTIAAGSGSTDPVYTDVASGQSRTLKPILPQSASGTRSFFLGAIGVTAPNVGGWVQQTGDAENDATVLNDDGELIPFSAGAWISQKNGIATPSFGGTNGADVKLLSIGNKAPYTVAGGTLSPATGANGLFGVTSSAPSTGAGAFARDVFIVVPTSVFSTSGADYDATLRTLVLGLKAKTRTGGVYVVNDFGFADVNGYTGTTGYTYSKWTN